MQSWIHLVEWQAAMRPEQVAYSDSGGDRVTYVELLDRVERTAGGWAALGVVPGDRVLVLLRNSVEYLVQFFAIQRVGAIPALLNWRLSANEFAGLATLFDPTAVVSDPEFSDAIDAALEGRSLVRVMNEGERAGWLARTELDAVPPPRPVDELHGHSVCVLLHTSGTTGQPKGIPLTNRSMITGLLFNAHEAGMYAGAKHLRFNPMFHFAGLAGALLAVLTGGEAHLLGAFDPAALFDEIEARRIAFGNAPPVAMRRLLDEYDRRERKPDLSSLEEIWYGSAPISPDLLERALGVFRCRFRQNYGMTESGSNISQLLPEDHVPGSPRLASGGRLQPFFELRIVDPTTGVDVERGESGELWARSDLVFPGYWNAPELTAKAFTDDGWYRTGDIGRMDDDGYLYLQDRANDMIVSGGENVYPTEVEVVLARHPSIHEISVIGIPSEEWGETVCAIVVVRPGMSLSADELIAWSRERLAHFKCPRVVTFRDVLPRNETGKVMRRTLRAPYWSGKDRAVG